MTLPVTNQYLILSKYYGQKNFSLLQSLVLSGPDQIVRVSISLGNRYSICDQATMPSQIINPTSILASNIPSLLHFEQVFLSLNSYLVTISEMEFVFLTDFFKK